MPHKSYIFLFALVVSAYAKSNVFQMEQAPASTNKDKLLQQVFKELLAHPVQQKKQTAVNGFSWKDCGSELVSVSTLSLQPDPIKFPGLLTLSVAANVKQTLKAPLKADVKLYKEVLGFYIEIPCIDNVGSCTYDDVCTMLADVKPCPQELIDIGINCKCPILTKSYKVMDVSVPVPGSEAIVSGDYKVQATILQGSTNVMCLEVKFSIAK